MAHVRMLLMAMVGLVVAEAPAAAEKQFPIEELRLIVRLPDAAGTWRIESELSKPGEAVLFDDDTVVGMTAAPSNVLCAEMVADLARDYSGKVILSSDLGLDASWWSEVTFVADPAADDFVVACLDRAGQQLTAIFSDYPREAAARGRAALLANAVVAAWIERVDGIQRVQAGEHALVVASRDALWWTDPTDGSLLRMWDEPGLSVQFERNAVGQITAADTETCASWMVGLGKMFTPSPGASFVPAQWHADAVVSRTNGDTYAIACLPRNGGGTILAEILYRGDPTTGDFDRAVKPLLAALAAVAGVPLPAYVAPVVAPTYTDPYVDPYAAPYAAPDTYSGPRRSSYAAYAAPTFTLSYLRLSPTLVGAEPSDGVALTIDAPPVGRGRLRGPAVPDLGVLVGYDPEAGVAFDARAGVGYTIGGGKIGLIPTLGLGADMFDRGAEDAPFRASLAAYGYGALLGRFLASASVVLEGRAAMVARAGFLDEWRLSGRVVLLRGARRKLSLDLSWRRFEAEGVDRVGADLLSIGVGIGN